MGIIMYIIVYTDLRRGPPRRRPLQQYYLCEPVIGYIIIRTSRVFIFKTHYYDMDTSQS